LAETEVALTTVIFSHLKDKNRILTGYEIFITAKSWYFIGVYIIQGIHERVGTAQQSFGMESIVIYHFL